VISAYNQAHFFERAVPAWAAQSFRDFELVIADDGSSDGIAELLERSRGELGTAVQHVRQPDEGFRKALALNRAILRARGDWLIFTDGDCIPSRTFVEEHVTAARPNTYVVGGHVRLTERETANLSTEDVRSGRIERAATLARRAGLWWVHLKSLAYIAVGKRRKPKFYGLNFSVGRDSMFLVNGFDATYEGLGKDDSDLRNRMQLARIRARSLWHRALVFHQWHAGHTSRGAWPEGKRYYNRDDLSPEAPNGLRELAAAGENA
jgi:glycosyltransferase involved in cell wall biosynthesis